MASAPERLVAPNVRDGSRGLKSSNGLLNLSPIPPILRPFIRAYLLGYASAVGPRLLTLILQRLTRRKRRRLSQGRDRDTSSFRQSALYIIRTGFDFQRFPTFCAVLVGGSTWFMIHGGDADAYLTRRLARWLATFISAWLGMRLLHSKDSPAFTEAGPVGEDGKREKILHGGRTVDLTLFAATRAMDVLVGEYWARHSARRKAAKKWTKLEQLATNMIDPSVFIVSCSFIMWAWFYHPTNLPRSYDKWITSAASVDSRLIEALRSCHRGELRYGEEAGGKSKSSVLGSMCADYGWPRTWGNPAETIPFPCDMVHMGCGPSCEYHAVSRFARSFRWSMYTYLPLALAFRLRRPTRRGVLLAVLSSARSSAFLGAFITLFYYGVCLARTRVGPRVVGKDVGARQRIDSGLCVGAGCVLCGWSVLIETASRRKDMALFVAPRALGTVVPRRYPRDKQWREAAVFAASAAIIMTCVLENPQRVRGVLGRLMGTVMKM
ncbi:integral membrane protein [Geosmithia morbida]|uniref:Integral membrane protein n=1 Tax=Geosmithia morbida TaxID=1094350 RepID=A0A9P4YZB7_9HYPO|nr:uncharacterized protein GMORB2_5510 [Geosmithia morbida]KAF4123794.1 integral membrane protein [Geosmithia morbida]